MLPDAKSKVQCAERLTIKLLGIGRRSLRRDTLVGVFFALCTLPS